MADAAAAATSDEFGWVSQVPEHLVAFDAFPWSQKKAFLVSPLTFPLLGVFEALTCLATCHSRRNQW